MGRRPCTLEGRRCVLLLILQLLLTCCLAESQYSEEGVVSARFLSLADDAIRTASSLLTALQVAASSPPANSTNPPPSISNTSTPVATLADLRKATNATSSILLTSSLSLTSPLSISKEVAIRGGCPLRCVLSSGQGGGRIFEVLSGGVLTLANLELRDGVEDIQAGAVLVNKGGILRSQNVSFINNTAERFGSDTDGGGAVLVLGGGSFESSGDEFVGNTAGGYGGAVLVTGGGARFASLGSTYVNNSARKGQDSAGGGAIRLANNASFASLGDTFEGNRGSNGGALRVDEAAAVLENSTFVNNQASNGGGVTCNKGGALNLTGNVFSKNKANNGPAINAVSGCILESSYDRFLSNEGSNLGGALSVDGSTATITGGSFMGNKCKLGGGAMWVLNKGATVVSTLCLYVNNTAAQFGGAVRIQDGDRFLSTGDVFEGNSAPMGGAFSIDGGAEVTAVSIRCTENRGKEFGGCIHASLDNSTLNSTGGFYTSNRASESAQTGGGGNGGAVFLTNKARGYSRGDVFRDNLAGKNGGAMLVENEAVAMSAGSQYLSNAALSGAAIALQAKGVLLSTDDSFIANNASGPKGSLSDTNDGGGIAVKSTAACTLIGGNFTGNIAEDSAGGVYAVDFGTNFTSVGNVFAANNSTRGGAIFVDLKATFSSRGDTFLSNTASKGGGVFLDGHGSVSSSGMSRCLFRDNWASGSGGGMFCSCNGRGGLPERSACCDISDCVLTNNTARDGGGGAVYSAFTPTITCSASNQVPECISQWGGNTAKYGPATATSPNELAVNASGTIGPFKSGAPLPDLKVRMVDDYNQTVIAQGAATSGALTPTRALTQVMSMRPVCLANDTSAACAKSADIRGAQNAIVVNGTSTFQELRLLAYPGLYRVVFFSPTSPEAGEVNVTVLLGNCDPGELLINLGCQACVAPQYSWNPWNRSCDQCPYPGARCEGGAVVLPDPGFWHSARYSAEFHECARPGWCDYEGRTAVLQQALAEGTWHPDLQCSYGRGGKKCAECQTGFGFSGSKCIECPVRGVTVFVFALFLLLNAGVVVTLIVFTARCKDPASRQTPSAVALLKTLVSYFQVTGISYLMQLRWPAYMQWVLSLVSDVSTTGGNTVPLTCMFSTDGSLRPSFQKLLLFALLPLFSLLLPYVLWPLWVLYKERHKSVEKMAKKLSRRQRLQFRELTKDSPFVNVPLEGGGENGVVPPGEKAAPEGGSSYYRKRYIMSMLVILFFFYPTVAYQFLLIFKCDKVDSGDPKVPYVEFQEAVGVYWWPDMGVECFKGTHLAFAALLGVFGLGVFCLGVPLLSVLLMFRCRGALDDQVVWEQFGFLYESYRDESYYWECISMLQKLAFVAVTVFFQNTMTQLLAALVIAEVCLLLQWYARPFRWKQLNRIQETAWCCTIGVLVLGLWYAARPGNAAYYVISSLVLSVNIVFTVFWIWQVRVLWRMHFKEKFERFLSKAKHKVRGGFSGSNRGRSTSFDHETIMAEYAVRSDTWRQEGRTAVPSSGTVSPLRGALYMGPASVLNSDVGTQRQPLGFVPNRPHRFDEDAGLGY